MAKAIPRVKTGINGLDEILGGGLHPGSISVIKGAPGTGKTLFGLEFISHGIENYNQPGLIVSFEELPEQIFKDAASIGLDLAKSEKSGKLKVILTSPDIFLSDMMKSGGPFDQIIVEHKIERAVIDSMSHLEEFTEDPVKSRRGIFNFVNGLRRYRITSFLTQEAKSIIGETDVSDSRLSYIADNVILLRFVEMQSGLRKALLVLKERASNHDRDIREYEITDNGIVIKAPFRDREGVLSGSPRRVAAAMEEFFKE
jgi:circadian clock protein KaiC